MAQMGIGYFDSRGYLFKTPEEATLSDLAMMLGRIGEGESLAPGIANMLLERRSELERIFAEHDELKRQQGVERQRTLGQSSNVTPLAKKQGAEHG